MSLPIDPVRLCCGQRHMTAQCPDGLVMCCICFSRFPLTGLNKTKDGYEDVCLRCAESERKQVEFRDIGERLYKHISICDTCVVDTNGEFITMCRVSTELNDRASQLLREVASYG